MNRNFTLKLFKSFVCGFGWILLIPFVLSFLSGLLLLFMYRLFANYIVQRKHPDWKPVNGPDLFFTPGLYLDKGKSRWNLCISFFLESDLSLTLSEIRDIFHKKVLTNPDVWKLKCVQRECLGFYYWVPTTLNLNNHITEVYLQAIPNETSEAVIDSFSQLLNDWILVDHKTKPHWELLVSRYKGQNPELNKTCFSFKMHHSIGTAASIRRVLELLDDRAESEVPQIRVEEFNLTEIARNAYDLPWTLIKTCYQGITMKPVIKMQSFEGLPSETDQVLGFGSAQIENVKLIAKAFEVPFRNVLAGVFASAVRRYLMETMDKTIIPENIPILLNLPWKYSEAYGDASLNNHVTQCFVCYPMHYPGSVDRFNLCMNRVQDFFHDGMDKFTYFSSYLGYLLPNMALRPMTAFCRSSAILSTDIPIYIKSPIKIFGSSFTQIIGQVGLYGPVIGFMAIFFTAGPRIDFSILGSTHAISTNKDAIRIGRYFNEELNTLVSHVETNLNSQRTEEISLPLTSQL